MSEKYDINELRKDALQHIQNGDYFLNKNTTLYKFLSEQAASVGESMRGVSLFISKDMRQTSYTKGAGTLIIGAPFFESTEILAGVSKHEFSHKKDSFAKTFSSKFSAIWDNSENLKTECRADFRAGKDMKSTAEIFAKTYPSTYTEIHNDHPTVKDRLESIYERSHIEQKIGRKLSLSEVELKPDCSFEVKSKIPAKVLAEAKKAAAVDIAAFEKANPYVLALPEISHPSKSR